MRGEARDREAERSEGAPTVSSALATVMYPVQYTSGVLHEALPFTKKGCAVLLKVSAAARLGRCPWRRRAGAPQRGGSCGWLAASQRLNSLGSLTASPQSRLWRASLQSWFWS